MTTALVTVMCPPERLLVGSEPHVALGCGAIIVDDRDPDDAMLVCPHCDQWFDPDQPVVAVRTLSARSDYL